MATFTRKVSTPCSWADVKEIIESGRAAQNFTVGDEFTETLTTGEEVVIVVAGIELYAKKQVIFNWKDSLADRHYMNAEWTNKGGWLASEMREYLNSTVLETLPKELRDVITPRTLHSGKKSGDDMLWLPSEYEIFGEDNSYKVAADDDKYIPYFQTPANRRKSLGKGGSAYYWWERSPSYSAATGFCGVGSGGGANGGTASDTYGVAPCFCI